MLKTLRIWTLGALIGAYVTTQWLIGEAERQIIREHAGRH